MGGAISLSMSHHGASWSQEHRPSHRELWDTSLFPSGCFAFDFHGAELFLPLLPDSKNFPLRVKTDTDLTIRAADGDTH